MDMLSLKDFKKNELMIENKNKIQGGIWVSTHGSRPDGQKYTDEYDDANGNGHWDDWEYGIYCID